MRKEEEIKKELNRLKEKYNREKKVVSRCDLCGQYPPIMGTFVYGEEQRDKTKMNALEWVLGETK